MNNILMKYLTEEYKISTIKSLIENDKNSGIIIMSKNQNLLDIVEAISTKNKREVIYFNKKLSNCPNYNLFYGSEEDCINNFIYLYNHFNQGSPPYFKDIGEQFLTNALRLLKRFKGDNVAFTDLSKLSLNPAGEGRLMVNKFLKMPTKNDIEQKENLDCATYFLESYFNEKSNTYENCISVRNYILKLNQNCSEDSSKKILNFYKIIKDGKITLINYDENFPIEIFLIGVNNACNKEKDINSNYLIIDDKNFTFFNLKKISDEENLEILQEKINLKKENKKIIVEKDSFGDIMKKNRISAGLSQLELANELEVSASFISDVERNEKSLSMPNLVKFCKMFKLSLDDLFLD